MAINDLSRVGFITNNSKSVYIWEPIQVLDWLGLRWNAIDATIHIIDRRLRAIFLDINKLITAEFFVSVRTLATLAIISAGPVVGNISRIMTRHCAMSIAGAQDWDSPFPMDEYSVREVYFWKHNPSQANIRYCFDMVSTGLVNSEELV